MPRWRRWQSAAGGNLCLTHSSDLLCIQPAARMWYLDPQSNLSFIKAKGNDCGFVSCSHGDFQSMAILKCLNSFCGDPRQTTDKSPLIHLNC